MGGTETPEILDPPPLILARSAAPMGPAASEGAPPPHTFLPRAGLA